MVSFFGGRAELWPAFHDAVDRVRHETSPARIVRPATAASYVESSAWAPAPPRATRSSN
jgi:hypothetical protein